MFGSTLDIERVFAHDRHMARTYVRRRLTALALGLGLVGLLAGPVSHALAGQGSARPAAAKSYVVRQGDTLWSIAARQSRGGDPRAFVDAIARANHLDAGSLVPGQALSIPALP